MSYVGNKDELVLCLYLMKHKRSNLAFYQEEKQLKHCIKIAKSLVSLEIKQSLLECNDIRRIRKHNTSSVEQSKITVPSNIQTITELHNLFINLQRYVGHPIHRDVGKSNAPEENQGEDADEYHQYFEVRRQVKIRWSKDKIGDTGWRAGWYNAEVQESELSSDEITVVYVSEPESTYKVR